MRHTHVRAAALPEGVTTLKRGQKVEFGVVDGKKGEQALRQLLRDIAKTDAKAPASDASKSDPDAIAELAEERGTRWPVMISGTITDASGRTLSGQTAEAFYASVAHGRPLSVGLNCALGAKELRQYVQELSRVCGTYVSCHPNAGLPNAFGGYDETPEQMAATLGDFAALIASFEREHVLDRGAGEMYVVYSTSDTPMSQEPTGESSVSPVRRRFFWIELMVGRLYRWGGEY